MLHNEQIACTDIYHFDIQAYDPKRNKKTYEFIMGDDPHSALAHYNIRYGEKLELIQVLRKEFAMRRDW